MGQPDDAGSRADTDQRGARVPPGRSPPRDAMEATPPHDRFSARIARSFAGWRPATTEGHRSAIDCASRRDAFGCASLVSTGPVRLVPRGPLDMTIWWRREFPKRMSQGAFVRLRTGHDPPARSRAETRGRQPYRPSTIPNESGTRLATALSPGGVVSDR